MRILFHGEEGTTHRIDWGRVMAEDINEIIDEMSTEEAFQSVYSNFKLHFYREVFRSFDNREATLTTVETFCMEVIYALNNPTVNEFANFIQISSPNAAYKVNKLVKKGYLKKVQSKEDRREYYLQVTQKFLDYYNISTSYVQEIMTKLKESMNETEWRNFRQVLNRIIEEQSKDIPMKKKRVMPDEA